MATKKNTFFGRPAGTKPQGACEICILAGGLGSRLGGDKSRLRLGGRTLLQQVRAAARATGMPTRVIREDLVSRCGPLGGVYTALAISRARSLLFLPCDMPFVSRNLLETLARRRDHPAVFVKHKGRVGFPFLLRRAALPVVRRQIANRRFSLKQLARALRAGTIRLSGGEATQLFNINTPEDLQTARDRWRAFRTE